MTIGISTTALVASPLIRSTKRDVEPLHDTVEAKLRLVARQRGLDPQEVTTRGVEVVNRQPRDARWTDVLQGEEVGNGPHLDLGKVQNLFSHDGYLAYKATPHTARGHLYSSQKDTRQ